MVKSGVEEPVPESSSRRRKLDDSAGDSPSAAKKQRTRISFSCGECHRRKQKCDRQIPCSHCISRKVPELCKAYTPGKADQDINARLSRLEHIIEIALPQFCGPDRELVDPRIIGRIKTAPEDEVSSQIGESDTNGGTWQNDKWYGASASGSVAPKTVLEQLQNAVMTDSFATDSVPLAQSLASAGDSSMEPTAADNLKSLVQECGVSPHKIAELLQELPPKRSSDVLIDYYFESINWTRYPISEGQFRASYTSICSNSSQGIGATNPNDVRFLPLLFVVLAIAVRLSPEEIGGDARTRRITSLRYYWSSRRSLLIAAAIQPDSLEVVLTRLLSARFLTFDRRITECWSQLGAAVRTAQALGFHRDCAHFQDMPPSEIEYRRRIWSYLYHADRSYALVLGRPNAIQDEYTSTRIPSNVNDETPSMPLPLSTPTPMTFVILRHQLASIMGRIVHHFQNVRHAPHYSDVGSIDDEILRFISGLPPHYALEPDTSLDQTFKYIPVHRFLLINEILFVRTGLHRPYLLRKIKTDRFARSRMACWESAIKDFEVRQAFRHTISKEAQNSLGNAYREFQTAMISGIYLALEPRGKYSHLMHAILDGFAEDHEGMREIDETTRRELQIIEILKRRASEQAQSSASPTSPTTSDNPAQLLLGLQQANSIQSFPSLFNLPASMPPLSPTTAYPNGAGMSQSPTFQRLQQASTDFVSSPTTSSSPSADEESPAQNLLDHWWSTVSNAPSDANGMSLAWGGPGGADFLGWAPPSTQVGNMAPNLLPPLDGPEHQANYWETLVSHLQQPGGT